MLRSGIIYKVQRKCAILNFPDQSKSKSVKHIIKGTVMEIEKALLNQDH